MGSLASIEVSGWLVGIGSGWLVDIKLIDQHACRLLPRLPAAHSGTPPYILGGDPNSIELRSLKLRSVLWGSGNSALIRFGYAE